MARNFDFSRESLNLDFCTISSIKNKQTNKQTWRTSQPIFEGQMRLPGWCLFAAPGLGKSTGENYGIEELGPPPHSGQSPHSFQLLLQWGGFQGSEQAFRLTSSLASGKLLTMGLTQFPYLQWGARRPSSGFGGRLGLQRVESLGLENDLVRRPGVKCPAEFRRRCPRA